MVKLMAVSVDIVKMAITLKKRLASGTLLAPTQLPIIPQVASWIPNGTIMRVVMTEVQIVIEAS